MRREMMMETLIQKVRVIFRLLTFVNLSFFLPTGNSEASDDGVMEALALFDTEGASRHEPSPR